MTSLLTLINLLSNEQTVLFSQIKATTSRFNHLLLYNMKQEDKNIIVQNNKFKTTEINSYNSRES